MTNKELSNFRGWDAPQGRAAIPTVKQPWPEDRRRELDRLGKLFRLAGKLNHSSGIAENIIALDALVTELGHDDLKNCRQSFMNWLEREATGQ